MFEKKSYKLAVSDVYTIQLSNIFLFELSKTKHFENYYECDLSI